MLAGYKGCDRVGDERVNVTGRRRARRREARRDGAAKAMQAGERFLLCCVMVVVMLDGEEGQGVLVNARPAHRPACQGSGARARAHKRRPVAHPKTAASAGTSGRFFTALLPLLCVCNPPARDAAAPGAPLVNRAVGLLRAFWCVLQAVDRWCSARCLSGYERVGMSFECIS